MKLNKPKKLLTILVRVLAIGFLCMNLIAFFHAYKFTHFANAHIEKTQTPEKLSVLEKVKTLVMGINNPRPKNKLKPDPYEEVLLQSNKKVACWYRKKNVVNTQDTIYGTVILFHGYGGEKSTMLDKADEFVKLKYDVLLVDFMGSGASEGNQTTLGYHEAQEVKAAYNYLNQKGEKNIFLFGTSMGSVAIMKAMADYNLEAKGLILECPFGSMYQTTCARFKNMNLPSFPMAYLLVFWGGIQNNFWAFAHRPVVYANKIYCPTLLLYGEKDKTVSRHEIDEIFGNLKGEKILKTYPNAGHENYLLKYSTQWVTDVKDFLY
ncbi:MAG: alpha/beta fold hydrolase [Chitinophagaceae bacterium]